MTAVCQDWDSMPPDVRDRLAGVATYAEGSGVLRLRWDGFEHLLDEKGP